ncbi:hypothetical protein ABZ137_15605 [Streptomyces bobili]
MPAGPSRQARRIPSARPLPPRGMNAPALAAVTVAVLDGRVAVPALAVP